MLEVQKLQLQQKLAKLQVSFKYFRKPCNIAAKNRTENRTWFTQKLHRVAATKIVRVNGPLRSISLAALSITLGLYDGVAVILGFTVTIHKG